MNKELYQIISGGGYFTHSIGKVTNPQTFLKLQSILSSGGLYSKEKLNKMLPYRIEGMVKGNIRITKECYVSLFDASSPSLEKRMLSPKFNTVFPLDKNDIFFLIDPSIEQDRNCKRSENSWQEIVVRDFVPLEYFRGIVIPNNVQNITEVQKMLQNLELPFPVFDFDGNTVEVKKGLGK